MVLSQVNDDNNEEELRGRIMWEVKIAYEIWVGKPEVGKRIGRPKPRRTDLDVVDFKEEDSNWIKRDLSEVKWSVLRTQ